MKAIKLCLLLCCVASLSWGQVRITEVNTTSGDIILTNMGGSVEDVSGWWLCNFPAYDEISSLPLTSGSTMLMAGASLTVTWIDAVAATGECGLYTVNSFTLSSAMEDYMEWGEGGKMREPVAVAAGVWCVGEFVSGVSPYSFTGGATDYCSAFWTGVVVSGCTDPAYTEFDPYAGIDDGSCVTLVVEGCAYEAAINYDSTANTDDGHCLFDCTDPCPGDFDGDLVINTGDVLTFLTVFGTNCD